MKNIRYSKNNKGNGVLIIYTGGTIGSMPKDRTDPDSPQVVVPWEEFLSNSPLLKSENLGFNVDAYSTEPLDSCNVGPAEWKEMAEVIKESYNKYEGFVILHGTDTMVYTASVLSMMLQNLKKPVIITGAQMTYLFNIRNDGWQNLVSALMCANPKFSRIPVVPEVCIYFGGKLFRGNRTRKVNATGFEAYISPNFNPLAELGDYIEVDESLLLNTSDQELSLRTRLETNVVAINFFPGIQDGKMLQNILKDKDLKGVVLLAYGSGNIPTDKKVLNEIKTAHDRGVVFYNVTQTGGGRVELGMYETSAMLLDVGVISGVDITPESALVKLMILLGDEDLSQEQSKVEAEIQINIAGEQSLSIYTTLFQNAKNDKDKKTISLTKDANRYRFPAETIIGHHAIASLKIDRIMLRFRDCIIRTDKEKLNIHLFADISTDDKLNFDSAQYLGKYSRMPQENETIAVFDITDQAQKVLKERSSFTVSIDGDGEFKWSSVELAIYAQS